MSPKHTAHMEACAYSKCSMCELTWMYRNPKALSCYLWAITGVLDAKAIAAATDDMRMNMDDMCAAAHTLVHNAQGPRLWYAVWVIQSRT